MPHVLTSFLISYNLGHEITCRYWFASHSLLRMNRPKCPIIESSGSQTYFAQRLLFGNFWPELPLQETLSNIRINVIVFISKIPKNLILKLFIKQNTSHICND